MDGLLTDGWWVLLPSATLTACARMVARYGGRLVAAGELSSTDLATFLMQTLGMGIGFARLGGVAAAYYKARLCLLLGGWPQL